MKFKDNNGGGYKKIKMIFWAYIDCNRKAPGDDLQGLVGVKNEGRSLFTFYELINIYNKLKSQDFFKTRIF
jgi:hypothetical protein